MTDLLGNLVHDLRRKLLREAAGRALTCPLCCDVLDCSRTVVFDCRGYTYVRCAACFDRTAASNAYDVEDVMDGRELFPTRKPEGFYPNEYGNGEGCDECSATEHPHADSCSKNRAFVKGRCRRRNCRLGRNVVWRWRATPTTRLAHAYCPECEQPLRQTTSSAWARYLTVTDEPVTYAGKTYVGPIFRGRHGR